MGLKVEDFGKKMISPYVKSVHEEVKRIMKRHNVKLKLKNQNIDPRNRFFLLALVVN